MQAPRVPILTRSGFAVAVSHLPSSPCLCITREGWDSCCPHQEVVVETQCLQRAWALACDGKSMQMPLANFFPEYWERWRTTLGCKRHHGCGTAAVPCHITNKTLLWVKLCRVCSSCPSG